MAAKKIPEGVASKYAHYVGRYIFVNTGGAIPLVVRVTGVTAQGFNLASSSCLTTAYWVPTRIMRSRNSFWLIAEGHEKEVADQVVAHNKQYRDALTAAHERYRQALDAIKEHSKAD